MSQGCDWVTKVFADALMRHEAVGIHGLVCCITSFRAA
jgi:hypothetical protein